MCPTCKQLNCQNGTNPCKCCCHHCTVCQAEEKKDLKVDSTYGHFCGTPCVPDGPHQVGSLCLTKHKSTEEKKECDCPRECLQAKTFHTEDCHPQPEQKEHSGDSPDECKKCPYYNPDCPKCCHPQPKSKECHCDGSRCENIDCVVNKDNYLQPEQKPDWEHDLKIKITRQGNGVSMNEIIRDISSQITEAENRLLSELEEKANDLRNSWWQNNCTACDNGNACDERKSKPCFCRCHYYRQAVKDILTLITNLKGK